MKKIENTVEAFLEYMKVINKDQSIASYYNFSKIIHHTNQLKKTLEGRLFEVFPVTAEFVLTNECNFNCPGCTYKYVREQSDHLKGHRNIERNAIAIILNKLKGIGVKGIVFTGGGEPFLHPDILYAIEKAKEMGFDFGINTNGSLLSDQSIERIMRLVPSYIRVSLDAGKTTHRIFHGTSYDWYRIIINNIKKLAKAKQRNSILEISILINSNNAHKLGELVDSFHEVGQISSGVDSVFFRPEVNYRDPERQTPQEVFNEADQIVNEQIKPILSKYNIRLIYRKSYFENINKPIINNVPCWGYGWISYIGWNGKLYFCSEFNMDNDWEIGDLVNFSFKEIWFGEKRKRLINRVLQKNINCPQVCKGHALNTILDKLPLPYTANQIDEILLRRKEIMQNISERLNIL